MENKTHFRRCHICGTVNWAEGQVVCECEGCKKKLAPFFFFDERKAMGLHGNPQQALLEAEDPIALKYPPLWGITVIW